MLIEDHTFVEISLSELSDLADKVEANAAWQKYRDFILQCYGPSAHSFRVEVIGQSDDEGGSSYEVGDLEVRNILGTPLDYDLELPYFAPMLAAIEEEWGESLDTEQLLDIVSSQEWIREWESPDSFGTVDWQDFLGSREYETIGGKFLMSSPPYSLSPLYRKA